MASTRLTWVSAVAAPRHGRAKLRYEWQAFGLGMLGWTVAAVLLVGGSVLVGDHERARALLAWIPDITVPMVIGFVFWPLGETVFPTRTEPPARTPDPQRR